MSTSVVILPPGFGGGSGGGNGGGGGQDSYTFDAPIFEVLGSSAGPSYSFTSYQDRGMYATASQLAFAVSGQAQLVLSGTAPASFARGLAVSGPINLSAGASIFNGPLSSPEGQTTAPVGSLYLSSNGGPNATVFYKATGNDQNGWRAVVDPSSSFPIYGPASGINAPTYSFLNGQGQPTNLGLYATAAGEIGLARNGTAVLQALTDGSIKTGPLTSSSANVTGLLASDALRVFGNALVSGTLSTTGTLSANGDLSVLGTTSLAGPLLAAGGTFAQDLTLSQRLSLPGGPQVIAGSGDPQGSVVAALGSVYLRSDSGGPPSLYSKVAGADANGWAALLTTAGLSYPLMAPSSPEGSPAYAFIDSSGAGMGFSSGVLSFSTASIARLQILANGTVRFVGAAVAQSTLSVTGLLQAAAASFTGNISAQQGFSVLGDTTLSGLVYLANGASIIGGTAASPAGSVSASQGSLYLSSSGGPGATLYVKEQGVGVTGWTAFDPSQYTGGPGNGGGTLTYPLQAPYGSEAAPSYGFAGAPMGVSAASDGSLFLSTGGAARLRADATGTIFVPGRLTVSGSVNLGSDFSAAGPASFASTVGVTGLLSGASAAFSGSLRTNVGLTLGATTQVLTGNLSTPEGTVSATAGSLYLSTSGGLSKTLFVKETDAGGSSSNSGWVAASGTGTGGGALTYPLQAPATAASAPSYAFAAPNGTNSGIYGLTDGSVGISSGGSSLLQLSPAGALTFTAAVNFASGSFAVTPAASFAGGLSVTGQASFSSGLAVGTAQVLSGVLPSPNGQVSAAQGSVYLSTAGGTNSTLWVRESGAATNWSFFGSPGQVSYPLRATTLGSAAATAFGFAADSGGSGMYAPTSGALALATGGAAALTISAAQASSFAGSLSVTGSTTLQALTATTLTASGASSLQGVSAGSLSVAGSATFSAGLGVGAAQVLSGSLASPDGQVSAPQGSVYLSTSGGINATLFVRQSGAANSWAFFGAPGQVTYPLRSPQAGTAGATAIGFTSDTGASGIYAPSSGSLGFSSGGSASLVLGTDQAASFSGNVSMAANLTVAAAGVLSVQGTSQFNGSSQFVATALFSQGVNFPGNETIFGGAQANPNGSVTASSGSLYLSSTGGTNKVLWVKETGVSSSTGWVAYGNPSTTPTTPSYPLLAPTGTTAAANIPYTFVGFTTEGIGYDTTTSATTLYAGGTGKLRATTTGIGLGLASPTASNVLLLASTTAFGGLSVGQPTIQLQSTAATGSSFSTVDSTGALLSSLSHNVVTADGVPAGTLLQSLQTKPLMFVVGTAYTNIAAIAYNVANSYFWTFGSKTQALSTVGVAGNLAIGATVATGTAAPTNGLLVQGASTFQGLVTFQGGATGLGSASATLSGTVTLTAATSGTVYFVTATATANLPAVAAGAYVEYTFVVAPAGVLTLKPPTGGTITLEATASATNGSAVNSGAASVTMTCFPGTSTWQSKVGVSGLWSVN